jgi:hypothetical protein
METIMSNLWLKSLSAAEIKQNSLPPLRRAGYFVYEG